MGMYYVRLPLTHSATIIHGNALKIDWKSVITKHELSYILGNPPFVGFNSRNADQKADMAAIFNDISNYGKLDYVCSWYKKAAEYIQSTLIKCAFVSTNSITQGEQVALLWKPLFEKHNIKIDFAYRTFQWTSAARGKAAVHCVIVGFSRADVKTKRIIFDGEVETEAANVNPYLLDSPNIFVESRSKPLCDVPEMSVGNITFDWGYLIFDEAEYTEFIIKEPGAQKYIKQFMGGQEFVKGIKRYCLWLVGANPTEIKKLPLVLERIENVRKSRLSSPDSGIRKLADFPMTFRDTRNPKNAIIIPMVTSERRKYIPLGFINDDVITNSKVQIIPNGTLYHFGILSSNVHMAWTRAVCGRMKSDYSYSKDIVYNNFVWCDVTETQKSAIEKLAQGVLDARALFPDSSLADLYDPLTMPPELSKAHRALDRAVMQAYGFSVRDMTEESCVAELMRRYREIVGG